MDRREALQRSALALGYALSGSTLAGVLAGCTGDRGTTAGSATPGRFLSAPQATTLAGMVDHLLPKTGTPGALDVGVDRFIDAMLKDYCSTDEQKLFTEGLAGVEAACQRKFGKTFAALATTQKDELFTEYEKQSPPLPPSVWGAPLSATPPPPTFYRRFKELSLVGYYTSETVGKTILKYDPVPSRFEGCIPLDGNNWAE